MRKSDLVVGGLLGIVSVIVGVECPVMWVIGLIGLTVWAFAHQP